MALRIESCLHQVQTNRPAHGTPYRAAYCPEVAELIHGRGTYCRGEPLSTATRSSSRRLWFAFFEECRQSLLEVCGFADAGAGFNAQLGFAVEVFFRKLQQKALGVGESHGAHLSELLPEFERARQQPFGFK